MYHGEIVPGFPMHPHRGFETVTIVTRGFVDHSDSLGASGRYGAGDVQWLTAGRGIQHAEMFPLLRREGPNPLELFQIWLNLPRASKMVEPNVSMLWRDRIPRYAARDENGRTTEVTVIAGQLEGIRSLAAPPDSWASNPDAHVAIWSVRMASGARWNLPPSASAVNRTLYFFRGSTLLAGATPVRSGHALVLQPCRDVPLHNTGDAAELLLLQGRPIGEPVAAQGPFVMSSAAELHEAYNDYRRTNFGGWPWPSPGPVHRREEPRFIRHPDGRVERPI
jgi:redox-sensitive bicupin YhaK (pirin superfamily)